MPRMGVSKASLEPRPPLPAGQYFFRVDGFKPAPSSKGDTTNFNPIMKVVNNPNGLNDRDIYFNLNSAAGWILKDFVHSLGLAMEIEGDDAFIPGKFLEDPADPANVKKYRYEGPIIGKIGRCEVAIRKSNKGNDQSYVRALFCSIQGCLEKHSTDLK